MASTRAQTRRVVAVVGDTMEAARWHRGLTLAGARVHRIQVDPSPEQEADWRGEMAERGVEGVVIAVEAPARLPVANAVIDLARREESRIVQVLVEPPADTTFAHLRELVATANRARVKLSQPFPQRLMLEDALRAPGARLGAVKSVELVWLRRHRMTGLLDRALPHALASTLAFAPRHIRFVTMNATKRVHVARLHVRSRPDDDPFATVTIGWSPDVDAGTDPELVRLTVTGTRQRLEMRLPADLSEGAAGPFEALFRVGDDVRARRPVLSFAQALELQAQRWLGSFERYGKRLPGSRPTEWLTAQSLYVAARTSATYEGTPIDPTPVEGGWAWA